MIKIDRRVISKNYSFDSIGEERTLCKDDCVNTSGRARTSEREGELISNPTSEANASKL